MFRQPLVIFNSKGQINKGVVSKPLPKELTRLSSSEKATIEYLLNAYIFTAYAAMRECNKLVEICNSCWSRKELMYPDVRKFITDCENAKSFIQITMNDLMDRCTTPQGYKRVSDLLTFSYDTLYHPLNAMFIETQHYMLSSYKRESRVKVLSQLVIARHLCVLANDFCDKVSNMFYRKFPFISDFIHYTDIANAVVALDVSFKFIKGDISKNVYDNNEFLSARTILNKVLTDKNFYPLCCKKLGYAV